MIRTVTDTIYRATGEPWAGAQVQFRLLSGSYAPDGTHPPDRVTATAGADGTLSVDLWCNADGETATLWECRLPGGDSFTFLLDYGDGSPIDLPSLRRGSITPTDPGYETLLRYIDEHGILPAQTAAQQATDAATAVGLAVDEANAAADRATASADAADAVIARAGASADDADAAAASATSAAGAATTAGTDAAAAAADATNAATEARASLAVPILDLAASRDLAASDMDALLRAGGAGAITLTIPADAALTWPVGRACAVLQAGAGAITVAAGSGVTLEHVVRTTRTVGSVLSILKTASDRWLVSGDGVA